MKNKMPQIIALAFSSLLFLGASAIEANNSVVADQPLGLKGIVDPLGKAFTLLWEPVKQNADGTPLSDLSGYNIYRRERPRGEAVKINPYLIPVTVYADRVDGKTFYYSVRAVDKNGNESADSFLVDSSRQANLIFLADDGHTSVTIPGNVGDVLRPAHNKYGVSLTIKFAEESGANNSTIVRNLGLQFVRGDTKAAVTDVSFSRPDADINIGYNIVGGQVALGAPKTQSADAPTLTNAKPNQLCLYWFNNINWIKLGGTNDEQTQTVNIKSSQLGNYQLRIASKANALTLEKANVFPGVFTPNGDGFNDHVYLVLENPQNIQVQGKILDLSGRMIAMLPAATQTASVGTSLTWSGHDSNGSTVPSGLYMYRIEGDGQIITGTVAVAR